MDDRSQQVPRRAGGRPTKDEALARDERLLAIATTLFETRGFEGTSMDALAEAAGVGKPTVYARFRDKNELFGAVCRRRADTLLAPLADLARAEVEAGKPDLASVLRRLALGLLERGLSPDSVAFHRMVLAQSLRFPEIGRLAQGWGWTRTVEMTAEILRAHHRAMTEEDAAWNADLFLSLVLGRLQQVKMLGLPSPSREEIEQRVERGVALFLRGLM